MISLETDRLTIRNFTPDDWPELQEMVIAYQASEAARYEDPWPTSAEKVKGIAAWFASGDDYLAVCLKTTGKLIGFVAINRRQEREGRAHNLGYVFHPGYHGQGYATEGCRAAMGYLFDQLAADGILTGTNPDNKPSAALLKRLGLHEVGGGEWVFSRADWLALELNETMAKQARQAFKTLRTAIQNCPDDLWKAGSGNYLVIARLAFHAIEAIDYHLDANPDQYEWGKYGIDWEGSDTSRLWDRQRTLDYLEEMLAKTLAFVDDPAGLLSEDVEPESCLSRLDHLCYALRHLTQHTGEINALLRQANAPVGNWL